MSKDDNKVAEKPIATKEEKKVFIGKVVPKEGLKIGQKKTTYIKQGGEFKTDNESLYLNLLNKKIIK